MSSSRRAVVRAVAWTAPVIAIAAAAPAFASSAQLRVIDFTSKDVSAGQSTKYQLAVTLTNSGASVSGYTITFTFDPAYGGVTVANQATGYDRSRSGNTATYVSTTAVLSSGTTTLTFDVNTSTANATANIDVQVTYSGVTSPVFGDTRII